VSLGLEILQGFVVGSDDDWRTFYVAAPMLKRMNDGEEFPFLSRIVSFGRVEAFRFESDGESREFLISFEYASKLNDSESAL